MDMPLATSDAGFTKLVSLMHAMVFILLYILHSCHKYSWPGLTPRFYSALLTGYSMYVCVYKLAEDIRALGE